MSSTGRARPGRPESRIWDGVLADGQLPALGKDAHRTSWSRTSCFGDRVTADLRCAESA